VQRFYREQFRTEGLFSFRVQIRESDLYFVCDADLEPVARAAVAEARTDLETWMTAHADFVGALTPLAVDPTAPAIVREMVAATSLYGVGPMAAVAGAVAQHAGEAMASACSHLIIENGGDIWLQSAQPLTVGVYAGEHSPFTGTLRFRVDPAGRPLGVCTSSGTVGHSLSFGRADAVVTVADRADVADAAATAIGNRIQTAADIEPVMDDERQRGSLRGLIVVSGDRMGAWGDLVLVR